MEKMRIWSSNGGKMKQDSGSKNSPVAKPPSGHPRTASSPPRSWCTWWTCPPAWRHWCSQTRLRGCPTGRPGLSSGPSDSPQSALPNSALPSERLLSSAAAWVWSFQLCGSQTRLKRKPGYYCWNGKRTVLPVLAHFHGHCLLVEIFEQSFQAGCLLGWLQKRIFSDWVVRGLRLIVWGHAAAAAAADDDDDDDDDDDGDQTVLPRRSTSRETNDEMIDDDDDDDDESGGRGGWTVRGEARGPAADRRYWSRPAGRLGTRRSCLAPCRHPAMEMLIIILKNKKIKKIIL